MAEREITVADPSVNVRPLYPANARVYAKSDGIRNGLEDEMGRQPEAIMMALRLMLGLDPVNGVGVFAQAPPTFAAGLIQLPNLCILGPDYLYPISAMEITPDPTSQSGLIELSLVSENASPQLLDFWDIAASDAYLAFGDKERNYRAQPHEIYLDDSYVPPASGTVGRIWILRYIMESPGGNVLSIERIDNQANVSWGLDRIQTKYDLTGAINAVVDGAPDAMNTLREISASILDIPAYATQVNAALAARYTKTESDYLFISKANTSERIRVSRTGNYLTWDLDLDGVQRPFG